MSPPTRAPAPLDPPASARELIPTRLTFPGAPHPRWWQIEDAAVDLGGFAPDRSHLATMLLADLAVTHAEDWFVFPVPAVTDPDHPTSGVLARLGTQVVVTDSFGIEHVLHAPPDAGPGAWSLFTVTGLAATDLVIWPVAVAPHSGPVLDDVVLGVDEDANLAWAVELRAEGRDLLADERSDQAVAETTRTGTRDFRYQPMTTLPPHWHPYLRHAESWRQGCAGRPDRTGAAAPAGPRLPADRRPVRRRDRHRPSDRADPAAEFRRAGPAPNHARPGHQRPTRPMGGTSGAPRVRSAGIAPALGRDGGAAPRRLRVG